MLKFALRQYLWKFPIRVEWYPSVNILLRKKHNIIHVFTHIFGILKHLHAIIKPDLFSKIRKYCDNMLF